MLAIGGPAAAAVKLAVTTASPVLGVDQEVEVRVTVEPDDERDTAEVPAPRLLASVGRVEELTRTGPRAFTARYLLPGERFPQVAILAAEAMTAGGPRRGFVAVRLRAAASPAFRTDPGAQVTIRIGDKEFGPVKAQRDGSVRIPVVVAPGVAFGLARSVNQYGKATEQTVDLKAPPFRRLLIVPPDTIAAGATIEVPVYAVESSGAPADPAGVSLRSSGPKPQPLGGGPGEARFLVRAPAAAAAGALHLEASLRDPAEPATADLAVVAGAPARLALHPDRSRLPIGVGSSMRIYITAQDRFGNAVDAGRAAVLVDGQRLEPHASEDGRTMAVVPAPDAYDGRERLHVEAALGTTYAAHSIALANLPPRRAPAEPDRPPRLDVTPRLGVMWNFRQPPGPAFLVEVTARRASWSERWLYGLATGVLASTAVAEDGSGQSTVVLRQVPALLLARLRHPVARTLAFGAVAGVGVTWTSAVVRSFGYDVAGTRLAPSALVGVEATARTAAGQLVLGIRYVHVAGGRTSSGDRLRGNSAGAIADLGYRLSW